jgi:hypothetical protein
MAIHLLFQRKEVEMKKVQFTAVFWTLLLSIPLTALAISVAAFATEHFGAITASLMTFSRETSISARGLIMEISERWPEVAGMFIGQLVIMTILLFARRNGLAKDHNSTQQ